MDISIILPVHNERENLRPLLEEIERAIQPMDRPFEVLAIDDGSTDGSAQLLQSLAGERTYLKTIRFRQNYGQSAAYSNKWETNDLYCTLGRIHVPLSRQLHAFALDADPWRNAARIAYR